MTVDELLPELKDIQPPDAPDWWLIPPAYLVAIGVIITISALVWLLIRYRRVNRMASLAEQELQRIKSTYRHNRDSHELSLQLAQWLKQVAMLAFPARQLEGLTGQDWLHFLDQSLGENRFSNGGGNILASSVYRKQANADVGQLVELCEQWLVAIKPRLQQRGRD